MRIADSSLGSSFIISATVGIILIYGLLPEASKLSKKKALSPLIKIEQADRTLQGE